MRTFIALELPDQLTYEIATMAHRLQQSVSGRFMKRETYHLTLAFLGDLDEAASQEVVVILDEVCSRYLSVPPAVDGLGTFGKPRDCTLWVGFETSYVLSSLAKDIREALKVRGIYFDPKPFKPHVTIARRVALKTGSLPALTFPAPSYADRVTFFKSSLDSEGAIYKSLYTWQLASNDSCAAMDCEDISDPGYSAGFIPEGADSTDFSSVVLDVVDVVRLEKMIAADGTPLSSLMNQAGLAVAQAAKDTSPSGTKICVLAGSGNNGGDGWVAAFDLAKSGYEVTLLTPKSASELTAEPAVTTAKNLLSQDCETDTFPEIVINPTDAQATALIGAADIVIDALLGTGFTGDAVKEPYASWIDFANNSAGDPHRISVDVPSGFDAQTGFAAAPTFRADETITMLTLKPGLIAPEAREYCGEIAVAPLADITPYLEALRY